MKQLLFFHATWCPPCRRAEKEVVSPLEQEVGPEKIRRPSFPDPTAADTMTVSNSVSQ